MDFSSASAQKSDALLSALGGTAHGLDSERAREILAEQGENAYKGRSSSWTQVAIRQFKSSFVYLLAAAALISFFLKEYVDALLVFGFLLLNATLGFIQEFRAERSLELLREFEKRESLVLRDGHPEIVPVECVVPGDIVLLRAGDMIPADGCFLTAEGVVVDESALTGESSPVRKRAGALPQQAKTPFEAHNIGFARTTLTGGEASLLIFATGKESSVGSIASVVAKTNEESAFEAGINQFSKFILKLALSTTVLIFIINLIVHRDSFSLPLFSLFSVALMISVVPETLPLVTTLSLTRGAVALAKKNVVPRRLSAIEDLGSIQILCTDKTGTITENKLAVHQTFGSKQAVLEGCLLGSAATPGIQKDKSAFDEALKIIAPKALIQAFHGREILDLVPFDPERKRESILVREGKKSALYVRGAPEVIFSLSGLKKKLLVEGEAWANQQGQRGDRILAVAKRLFPSTTTKIGKQSERNLGFIGMVSFFDPLKPSTKQAVKDARRLGVQIKIITGDSREVAGWVGCESGIIEHESRVITGEEFDRLSLEEKKREASSRNVFARMLPMQKYEIIELLKEKSLVGFLGEGFNDAPALKLAHVAIAVRGASDIAQDNSDIILLNKSLEVIIDGIREGRRVFANTTTYIKATLASNFGNFYALAFASLVVDYLPMLPVQILLLNLLSDFPMLSISTDHVDEEELLTPKKYNVKEIAFLAITLGLISTLFDFSFFGIFVRYGESNLQALWFVGSVLTELALLFSIRTSRWFFRSTMPSVTVFALTGFMAILAILLPLSPWGSVLFSFGKPPLHLFLVAIGIVVAYFITTELVKRWYYTHLGERKQA
ncbi:MAG: HAD-IC family P-type ATPase [Patescibacteria group bacterium]